MQQDDKAQGEIIIVRRNKNNGEEEHHGGVWKIAFADFMTAMMAFFLVMWLVNASNEKTKKAVASYFNPIKLTDTTTNSKGVNNPKYGVDDQTKKNNEETTTIDTPAKIEIKLSTDEKKFDEQALFVDPYSILAEIEGGVGKDDGADEKFAATDPGDGQSLNKGVSFQDPFDPNSWDDNKQTSEEASNQAIPDDEVYEAEESSGLEGTGSMNGETDTFEQVNEDDLKKPEVPEAAEPEVAEVVVEDDSDAETKNLEIASLDTTDKDQAATSVELAADKDAEAGLAQEETASGEAEAGVDDGEVSQKITDAKAEIEEKLEAALTESQLTGLDVEVIATSEGVIVVLSDNNRNGMFSVGSARPTPALVKTMSKLGGVIAEQNGAIEISGHTDARPYQSENYDNWRLSSARAHMAYYMLARGGMKEKRVSKIVGQAAVNLKDPENPNAAVNRRIEVFIKPQ